MTRLLGALQHRTLTLQASYLNDTCTPGRPPAMTLTAVVSRHPPPCDSASPASSFLAVVTGNCRDARLLPAASLLFGCAFLGSSAMPNLAPASCTL